MTSPLALPDWAPWWVHLVILLALGFVLLMLVLMPFSVFGTKARLEAIEIRLDEIQAEIRNLALRIPEMSDPEEIERGSRFRGEYRPPPLPPAAVPIRQRSTPSARTEPRLY